MNSCSCIHDVDIHSVSGCKWCVCNYKPVVTPTTPFPGSPANTDDLIQYTADQLDIPYRISKAGREYCVYYIGMGKGLIELVIMSNMKNLQFIPVAAHDTINPWYVTWNTPTTQHKETLARFTDILLLIQLLTEGVNAKRAGKTEAHK